MAAKVAKSYRLGKQTVNALDKMAQQEGITTAQAISILVRLWDDGALFADNDIRNQLDSLIETCKLAKEL